MQQFKKSFFTTILLILIPFSFISGFNNQLITEIIVTNNDSLFRYLYLYDTYGNKVVETKYFKENSSWIRNSQTEWVYENNVCTSQKESYWKNNKWTPTYSINYIENGYLKTEIHNSFLNGDSVLLRKIESEFDANGLKQKREFVRNNSNWEQIIQSDFAYNENHKTSSIITSVINSGNVEESFQSIYSYNSDEILINQLLKKKTGLNDWLKTDSIIYYYVPNTDTLVSQRNKIWNNDIQKWENKQKVDYVYDNTKHLMSETYQYWNTMFWKNDVRYDYKYEDDNKQTLKTLLLPIYEKWRNAISIVYSDFLENNAKTIESKFEFWGGNTGELTTSYIPFYFNNEPTIKKAEKIQINYAPINDTISGISLFELKKEFPIYPNPSTGVFYVNTEDYNILSWVVTDLNGRILKTQNQLVQSGIIDITDLKNGIYILKVNTDNRQIIRKIIKI